MGRLKQLLTYRGRTLVQHAVEQAREAALDPIIVVVGAGANEVQTSVSTLPVEIAVNEDWPSGMGSSLAIGMRRLQEIRPDIDAVAILLADQPHVHAEHLHAMRSLLEHEAAPIVAAHYNDMLGVPAFFKREMFAILTTLPPESGARYLLRGAEHKMHAFALEEAATDIDTPEDFANLQRH